MISLGEYFTMSDRVIELERQLRNSVSNASYYKQKCHDLEQLLPKSIVTEKITLVNRTRQAIKLLIEGKHTITEIAELCFISKTTIYDIRWRVKNNGAEKPISSRIVKGKMKQNTIDML